jgi:hypothetical protein
MWWIMSIPWHIEDASEGEFSVQPSSYCTSFCYRDKILRLGKACNCYHHGFENKNVHMGLRQEYPWETLKDRIPCLGCLGYIKDIGFGYSQMYGSTNTVGCTQRVNNYYILKEDFSSSMKLVTSWGWTQCHLSLLLPFKVSEEVG